MNENGKKIKAIVLEIEKLQSKAAMLAYKFIEEEARKVMRKHPTVKSFCMAMGRASFYDASGSIDCGRPFVKTFYDKADGLDEMFNIYGSPLKIKGKDGEAEYDW